VFVHLWQYVWWRRSGYDRPSKLQGGVRPDETGVWRVIWWFRDWSEVTHLVCEISRAMCWVIEGYRVGSFDFFVSLFSMRLYLDESLFWWLVYLILLLLSAAVMKSCIWSEWASRVYFRAVIAGPIFSNMRTVLQVSASLCSITPYYYLKTPF